MHVITRMLEFDAGHRVYQHESKCAHVHGHRYCVELSVSADALDPLGRVIDFSVLKSVCGQWIDDNWDHGMILNVKDPLCDVWRLMGSQKMKDIYIKHGVVDKLFNVGEQKHYMMDGNPTAENMAEHLYVKFQELLADHGITVVSVKLWETPNCFALYVQG